MEISMNKQDFIDRLRMALNGRVSPAWLWIMSIITKTILIRRSGRAGGGGRAPGRPPDCARAPGPTGVVTTARVPAPAGEGGRGDRPTAGREGGGGDFQYYPSWHRY